MLSTTLASAFNRHRNDEVFSALISCQMIDQELGRRTLGTSLADPQGG